MKRLGLIVNPVAGMGGRVGLKGSDGEAIIKRAVELGAVKLSPGRAVDALRRIARIREQVEVITYPGEMGEDEVREAGFQPTVIGSIAHNSTTREDTVEAARTMAEMGVDLIMFAGGDGTARDLVEAVDGEVPVLGIPAGVKIHSGVFAINPADAGELAALYLEGGPVKLRELEVMDIDEEAFRDDRLSARLYGYLKVPYEEAMIQNTKSGSATTDEFSLEGIAADIVEEMERDVLYVLGPGTTVRQIAERLGLSKTLLGVDVVLNGELIAADANEEKLLELIDGKEARIIVTVIGGQGFVLGRGNQQISPQVIRSVGVENITIIATPGKLAALQGRPLLVDTGDPEVDEMLVGYAKVVTEYGRRVVYRVKAGGST
ncbi:ATP-NAD kinase family protein [Candidatus Bathyarchaeota archaeon]|nr:ATP-NAD kinase family protein [Candidatus Bathyarchaeota archaeon]